MSLTVAELFLELDLEVVGALPEEAQAPRLTRQAAQMTVHKLHMGGLVDLVHEPKLARFLIHTASW